MKETIEYQNIHGNRKHKDSLFRKVFRKKKDFSRKHPNVVNYQIMKIRSYVDINNNPYRENK